MTVISRHVRKQAAHERATAELRRYRSAGRSSGWRTLGVKVEPWLRFFWKVVEK
jgi:hypothetical protein